MKSSLRHKDRHKHKPRAEQKAKQRKILVVLSSQVPEEKSCFVFVLILCLCLCRPCEPGFNSLLQPGSHQRHKHKHKHKIDTKQSMIYPRIFLCFVFCSAFDFCFDYVLMLNVLMLLLWDPGRSHNADTRMKRQSFHVSTLLTGQQELT